MSENSKIEWCDHTFNPWTGCTKVSPGCDHCYAQGWARRSGTVRWGPGAPRRRTSPANWRKPLAWNRRHAEFFAAHGRRQRVFCASLADVFDNAADPQWRTDLFRLIADTPNLDWLLLTKRIGNAAAMIDEAREGAMVARLPTRTPPWPWPNVWLGATIVNQEEADRDNPKLLATPAALHFLSCEPLLGPINLSAHWLTGERGQSAFPEIGWVIAGGESGNGARPMTEAWAQSLKEQCHSAGVPFFMKQMGGARDKRGALEDLTDDLRVREMPDAR